MPDRAPVGIVVVGMPGSGKSTVGRLLAERLGRPFVDTDERFAERHGTPVPAYLEAHGEARFRDAEARIVAEACGLPGTVIAAGGGAVLDPIGRWALWHHGAVAWLDVPPERLVERLRADGVRRPTFEPYDPARLARVLADRAGVYRAADRRVDADRDPARVTDDLLELASRRPIVRRLFDGEVARHHPIGPATARIVIGTSLDLRSATPSPHGVAVVDPRAPLDVPWARARLAVRGGERSKRLTALGRILEWLADERVERGEPLLAVGGGTVGDLAGTAAALFARGLPLVHVPTTWLAQADSAIGGKVAIDLARAKNAVGAFWPPVGVHADVRALDTLPRRLRRDGAAESVKAGFLGDPGLWRLLETRGPAALRDDAAARFAIIERSARLKLAVCDRDPFEQGERRTLNLGHTVGHALEIASGYRLRHGTAVALGMRAVTRIGIGRGADPTLPDRLDTLLDALGFGLRAPFDADAVRTALTTDKKRSAGRLRWIVPMEVGRVVEADDVSDAEIDAGLAAIAA